MLTAKCHCFVYILPLDIHNLLITDNSQQSAMFLATDEHALTHYYPNALSQIQRQGAALRSWHICFLYFDNFWNYASPPMNFVLYDNFKFISWGIESQLFQFSSLLFRWFLKFLWGTYVSSGLIDLIPVFYS